MFRAWSCDTFVAQTDATRAGRLIFGKNSDRPAGEAQPLRAVPARAAGDQLDLAYVSIADAPAYAHFGAAPHWCWGYEFGINEHNVVIGNEAQFTRAWAAGVTAARAAAAPEAGIVGMELLRLGLERGGTAAEALAVMTDLIERYGQWGSGVFGKQPADGAYDNSYLIADPTDAWVLETSGREWVARQVASGTYSISNQPSIRTTYDRASSGLISAAMAEGWHRDGEVFDYAASHVDPQTPLQVSQIRQRRSAELLSTAADGDGVEIATARQVLRDHYEGTFLEGPYFNAARPDFLTLCMHEHPAGFTWGNTAGSTIVDMPAGADDLTVIWWTPLPPCVGAYIPLFLPGSPLPSSLELPAPHPKAAKAEEAPVAAYDSASYWWRMQNLHDAAKGDEAGSRFTERQAEIRKRLDALEASWDEQVNAARAAWRNADRAGHAALTEDLQALTQAAVDAVDAEVESFLQAWTPKGIDRAYDPRWA